MIQLTEQQLTELLHKATGNVKGFVCDNKGWISENLPKDSVNKNEIYHSIISCFLKQQAEKHNVDIDDVLVGMLDSELTVQSYNEGRNEVWKTHEWIEII